MIFRKISVQIPTCIKGIRVLRIEKEHTKIRLGMIKESIHFQDITMTFFIQIINLSTLFKKSFDFSNGESTRGIMKETPFLIRDPRKMFNFPSRHIIPRLKLELCFIILFFASPNTVGFECLLLKVLRPGRFLMRKYNDAVKRSRLRDLCDTNATSICRNADNCSQSCKTFCLQTSKWAYLVKTRVHLNCARKGRIE